MGTSRSIAVVGLRTVPSVGWRADVVAAMRAVRRRPELWLLGIIGFALRGGIMLLTLPILVVPTQVEVRLALGDGLGSTGLTEAFWTTVVGVTALTLAALLVALYLLARVEVGAFVRLMHDAATDDARGSRQPRMLSAGDRRALAARLFVLQSLGLLLVLVSAVPLAAAIGDAALREIVAPSSSEVIYLRVLGQVGHLALVVVAAVALVEIITALLGRAILMRATGLVPHEVLTRRPPLASAFAHPGRTLATAAFGWLLFVGALVPGVWAISLAWQTTRAVFLATGWSNAFEQAVALFGVAILLAAVFGVALLVCGIVSALRAGLWSLASLR